MVNRNPFALLSVEHRGVIPCSVDYSNDGEVRFADLIKDQIIGKTGNLPNTHAFRFRITEMTTFSEVWGSRQLLDSFFDCIVKPVRYGLITLIEIVEDFRDLLVRFFCVLDKTTHWFFNATDVFRISRR